MMGSVGGWWKDSRIDVKLHMKGGSQAALFQSRMGYHTKARLTVSLCRPVCLICPTNILFRISSDNTVIDTA